MLQGQVNVTGAFDRDTIPIGSEASFTLSINLSGDEEILVVPTVFLDSMYSALQTFKSNPGDTTGTTPPVLADFELIDLGQWSDNNSDGLYSGDELSWNISTIGNQRLHEQTFKIKFWDPGSNIILIPPILISQNGQQEQHYQGGQVSIYVAPPAGVEAISPDSLNIEPIKPILTEAKNIRDYLIYFYILSALLIGIIVYWLYRRWTNSDDMTKVDPEKIEVIIPAHTMALDALYDLRQEQLWQKGAIKEYQSKLTFIIRQYLENRYEVQALESTTDEIVRNLSAADLELKDVDALKRILQVADLVKFAKAKPDESIHESFMTEAEDFVVRTKVTPLKDVEDE